MTPRSGRVEDWTITLEYRGQATRSPLGLARAAGWAAVPLQNHDRAVRMAWSRRADLAPGDRLLLEASRPGYPDGATSLEILRQEEAAVERAPHTIELRYLLGDAYMHHGPAVGMTPEEGYRRLEKRGPEWLSLFEDTRRVVGQRRLRVLRELSDGADTDGRDGRGLRPRATPAVCLSRSFIARRSTSTPLV